ncbi:hypothetical protein DAPPUDRAFT_257788 [Daphnia pulex]|uniref:Secreted protein n=1 Tax=Daphnia pulex TaxID=6669 RepID=E9HE77_DAPPU|nr:hypothetical protein DAPPUDRAFT_257788 [Daphnia pulex]|eukprot:EFX69967.1 hypothetical protein DAPPUDRAFT_257788 [Daphnia pulex]
MVQKSAGTAAGARWCLALLTMVIVHVQVTAANNITTEEEEDKKVLLSAPWHTIAARVCSAAAAADCPLVILMGDGPRLSLCGPVLDKQQHSTRGSLKPRATKTRVSAVADG